MKTLYFISGTMGVGKTTVCQILKSKLSNSVFLDGDSCWNYKEGNITEQDKKEVINTIVYKLNSYLSDSKYENIIFCWVMHEQSIINEILSNLTLVNCSLISVSLICTREALIQKLSSDVENKLRKDDIINKSLERLPLYKKLGTIKINTTNKEPFEVANKIIELKNS